MYYEGKGVERSFKTAAEWYLKAAEQGFLDSQYRLGHMYQRGEGVERSDEESRRWFDMWQS
jgi:TPR repeat protein